MDEKVVIGIFQFIAFIFSVVIHEVSHGYVAERLGDPTARLAGRLTLNPLKHIDPFGSIILPLLLAVSGLPVLGWALPVPYNPLVLRDPKKAAGLIAAAGPISNLVVALIFGFLIRLTAIFDFWQNPVLPVLLVTVIYVNVLLAVFNLVPIPPLDGSKVLFAFLPRTTTTLKLANFLERYGLYLVFGLVFFGWHFIEPLINGLFLVILGRMPF